MGEYFGVLLAFVLALLVLGWIFLPFTIIGTKPLLRELIEAQKRTNQLLAESTYGNEPRVTID